MARNMIATREILDPEQERLTWTSSPAWAPPASAGSDRDGPQQPRARAAAVLELARAP